MVPVPLNARSKRFCPWKGKLVEIKLKTLSKKTPWEILRNIHSFNISKGGFFFSEGRGKSILLHRAVLLYCCTGPLQSPRAPCSLPFKELLLVLLFRSHTSQNMAGSFPTSVLKPQGLKAQVAAQQKHQQNRKLCHRKPRPDSRFNGIPEASAKPESMS